MIQSSILKSENAKVGVLRKQIQKGAQEFEKAIAVS